MAPKKGRALERRRAEEAARKDAARRAAARRRTVVGAGSAGLIVALAVVVVALQPTAPGHAYPDQGNLHLESIDQPHAAYNSRPPSSGPHVPALANWGESESVIPPELFIHNLEDGGVVLAYSCSSDCPQLVEGLRSTLRDFDGRRILLTPYDDIVDQSGVAHRAAAVAWGRVWFFDELTESTRADLETFIRTFEGVDHHVRASNPLSG